jgi:uncharacterized protein YjeT (DUF2065 family)
MESSIWLALGMGLAMVLVIEGLLPLLSPTSWRKAFEQALRMNDGQIRFFGLCSVVLGLLAIAFLS